MLQPYLSIQPSTSTKPIIDYKNLLRWLTQLQGNEVEIGGFKGRTNKLVDGCYSWWVGGAFPLLEALGVGGMRGDVERNEEQNTSEAASESWDDVDGMLVLFSSRV